MKVVTAGFHSPKSQRQVIKLPREILALMSVLRVKYAGEGWIQSIHMGVSVKVQQFICK